jgi:hypothetical protein
MKKKILIILLWLFAAAPLLKAGINAPKPAPRDTVPVDYDYKTRYGFGLPSNGEYRILIIFVDINYDTTIPGITDPSLNWLPPYHWLAGQLPDWRDDMIDLYWNPITLGDKPMTKYFSQASFGKFKVIGDYLKKPGSGDCITINLSDLLTTNGGVDWGFLPSKVIAKVNAEFSTLGLKTKNNLIPADFDKWTQAASKCWLIKPNVSDNKYDHVAFIVRNYIGAMGYSDFEAGTERLITYPTPSTKWYVQSFTVNGSTGGNFNLAVIRHEFGGHGLLGGNSLHAGGGGYDPNGNGIFFNLTGGHSMLGLNNCAFSCWNAWDRQRLDWKPDGNTYNPAARNASNTGEVNGEIDGGNPAHAGIYVLRDFVKYGDALKIKLPYGLSVPPVPGSIFEQWLWIENHNANKVAGNYSEFDVFQYQNLPCVNDAEYGLYMYIQVTNDTREATSKTPLHGDGSNYLKPICADGNFDYIVNSPFDNTCINSSRVNNLSKSVVNSNPFTGNNDLEIISKDDIDIYNNIISWDEGNLPIIVNNDPSYPFLGHGRHAFRLGSGGNSYIGVGTNPSTANVLNKSINHGFPPNNPLYVPDRSTDVRKIYLNGLSVEILEQNSAGFIKVKVRTDDVDIKNDVRWCADEILTTPVITANGIDLNLKSGKVIFLDRGKTPTRPNNPVWVNNEKLFNSPTVFRVMPGTFFNMESNSKLIIDNGSTVYLESGSRLDMGVDALIIIRDGSKMIMNSNSLLKANTGAKIIIEPTGQLIIDGAVLTSKDANTFWEGIEVLGDCYKEQLPQYQGYVEIKNGGIIERANIGIYCKQNICIPSGNEPSYTSSGGIIFAYGAVFKSNKIAISVEPYKPNIEYNSIIANCNFINLDGIYATNITYIKLNGIKNINIFGNTFTGNTNCIIEWRGIAIEAHDATFILNNPFGATNPNLINDMTYGIACYNTNPNTYPTITNTNFTDNLRAIYLSGVNGAQVVNNTIYYKSQSTDPLLKAYGIYLDNCIGYHVEGNQLNANDPDNKPENGIIVNNSGTEYNQVYRNNFIGIKYPINAQNTNRSSDGYNGLEILCNTVYDAVTNDIIVTTEGDGDTKGIRILQGDHTANPKIPAGNLFTSNGNSSFVNYINATYNMFYYAHYEQFTPINYQGVDYYVTPKLSQSRPRITNENTEIEWQDWRWVNIDCPDLSGNLGGGKSLLNIEDIKAEIEILQPRIDSAYNALMQKMDNGNTAELIIRINSCQPSGFGKLYSDLKKYSPYLSEEVLKAIIQKQGFQRNLLINLLLANPHVAKTNSLMQALIALQPPLSAQVMENIENMVYVFSVMEIERAKLANLTAKRDNNYYIAERYYANDSLPASYDSLGLMLERDPRITAKYQLVYFYISKLDTNKADYLAGHIPLLYNLNASEQKEYTYYKQLYELKRKLQRDGKSFKNLNQQQQQMLLELIINPSLSLGEMSDLNALRQVDDVVIGKMGKTRGGKNLSLNYNEPILEPVENKEDIIENNFSQNEGDLIAEKLFDDVMADENGFKLYPNPAVDELNVFYNINEISNASVEIYNINGLLVNKYDLSKNSNNIKINTQNMSQGVYYIVLIKNGSRQKVEKLVIQ